MLMPSVSVMSTQMLRSWPKQVQNGSRGRNPSRVITPHASTVPTTARGRSAAIFSPQPSGAGCPSTQRRSHGIVSDTSTVMPAAWTSALCSVTEISLWPARANSAVRMPAALTLARPTRNQCVDVRRRIVSAEGTRRSYQDAPASDRRSRNAARTAPVTSSATPTPTVVQWRGIPKAAVSATANPTSVTISPASIRPNPGRRHAISEPPGGGEGHAIVPVELAVQRAVRALEEVGADRQRDGAADQVVDPRAQPEVAAVDAGHEEHGRVQRVVEEARRRAQRHRRRHRRGDTGPRQVRGGAHEDLLAELQRRVDRLEERVVDADEPVERVAPDDAVGIERVRRLVALAEGQRGLGAHDHRLEALGQRRADDVQPRMLGVEHDHLGPGRLRDAALEEDGRLVGLVVVDERDVPALPEHRQPNAALAAREAELVGVVGQPHDGVAEAVGEARELELRALLRELVGPVRALPLP